MNAARETRSAGGAALLLAAALAAPPARPCSPAQEPATPSTAPAEETKTSPALWPRFRGPNGSGVAAAGKFPTRFGPDENVVWKASVPAGQSSPVLSDELVFLTTASVEALSTLAFDRFSGELRWRADEPRRRAAEHHPHNGPASPTPAVGGGFVVVFFEDFGLIAYGHDGKERWRHPLGPFECQYGLAASPIVVEERVIQAVDQRTGSFLLALDARDGSVVWRTERPAAWSSYSTPVVYDGPTGKELLHAGTFLLECFDLASGARLRFARGTFYNPKSGPVVQNGVAYVAGFGPARAAPGEWPTLSERDADGDGRIALEEMENPKLARTATLLVLADGDDDGKLDAKEWDYLRVVYHHIRELEDGSKSLLALRLAGEGDVTEQSYLWTRRGAGAEVPLPLVASERIYALSDEGGVVAAIAAATGEILERRRLDGPGDRYFASPVAAGGKLFIVGFHGTAHVLDAGPGLATLAVNELGESCYATPALALGRIYLRTDAHLYCFSELSAEPEEPSGER